MQTKAWVARHHHASARYQRALEMWSSGARILSDDGGQGTEEFPISEQCFTRVMHSKQIGTRFREMRTDSVPLINGAEQVLLPSHMQLRRVALTGRVAQPSDVTRDIPESALAACTSFVR